MSLGTKTKLASSTGIPKSSVRRIPVLSKAPARIFVPRMGCVENVTYENQRMDAVTPGLASLVEKDEGFLCVHAGHEDYRNPYSIRHLQSCGDITVIRNRRISTMADFKFEKVASPNFFCEIWSNYIGENDITNTKGWMLSSLTDYILYSFDDCPFIAVIELHNLRKWLGITVNMPQLLDMENLKKRFQVRSQGKYTQLNNPLGLLVPFSSMPSDVLVAAISMNSDENQWSYVPSEFFVASLPQKFGGTFSVRMATESDKIEGKKIL